MTLYCTSLYSVQYVVFSKGMHVWHRVYLLDIPVFLYFVFFLKKERVGDRRFESMNIVARRRPWQCSYKPGGCCAPPVPRLN